MDFTLKMSSSMTVSGPSQCGKSTFTHGLLALKNEIFNTPPSKIYWYYGQYTKVLATKPYILEQGLPESFDHVEEGSVIVLDDLMHEGRDHEGITGLFTKMVHHRNLFVINIVQNFFNNSKETRTRRLNTQYIIMFKNPSDATQIKTIGRQMYPTDSYFLPAVFLHVTKRPHGYIFIDLRQETPENQRIRSNILKHEFPMQIFSIV